MEQGEAIAISDDLSTKTKAQAAILLVDDRPDGLLALDAALRSPLYEIHTASSGFEAVHQIQERDFAVVLLDVQMPIMDGFETATRIRKMPRGHYLPIIFITAIGQDEHQIFRGYDSGAVDFLLKPINHRVLRSKVSVFVDLYNKNRKIENQARALQEHERREKERIVRLQELENLRRYRTLADAIPHMVLKTDLNGAATYLNQLWCDYTGICEGDTQGTARWQDAIHVEDGGMFRLGWETHNATQQSFEIEARMIRHSDKSPRWHLIRAVPEKSASEEPVSWIFTFTDIHDRKSMFSRLQERTRALEQSNKELEQFAYVISHDLQEPLRKVTNYIDLLGTHAEELDQNSQKYCDIIVKSAKKMHQLISDLLSFSRVARDSSKLENVDMEKEFNSALEAIPGTENVHLTSDVLPQIHGNSLQVRQLFQNLIGNAVKFRSERTPEIHVTAQRNDGDWEFMVRDNGIGIPSEYKERIFIIFQRLHSQDKYPGTGIGLALCKKIVESRGGRIWVESKVGEGSTFHFTIPDAPLEGDLQEPLALPRQA